jgi:hypothetical protein
MNFYEDNQAITIYDAARIKMVPENRVWDEIGDALNGARESGLVCWDENFVAWSPTAHPGDLAYRANLARMYTKTIRIDVPLRTLIIEAGNTASHQAAEWDIVPVNYDNYELLLLQQFGSLDGNVGNEYLRDRVRESLRIGRPVYQKRIHTTDVAYTQGLHPTPELAALSKLEGTYRAAKLDSAIENGEINYARYRGATLVLMDDDFTAWADDDSSLHHELFSNALLRA